MIVQILMVVILSGNVNSDVALLGDDSNDEGDSAEEVVSDESLEDLASVGDTDDKPIAFADFFYHKRRLCSY